MRFGEFFKTKRLERKLTIREFCTLYEYDSGNISKLERGLLLPPQSPKKLEEYAKALGLKKESADYGTLMELAAIDGRASQFKRFFHLADSKAAERFPEFFLKLTKAVLTEEKLGNLIDAVS